MILQVVLKGPDFPLTFLPWSQSHNNVFGRVPRTSPLAVVYSSAYNTIASIIVVLERNYS